MDADNDESRARPRKRSANERWGSGSKQQRSRSAGEALRLRWEKRNISAGGDAPSPIQHQETSTSSQKLQRVGSKMDTEVLTDKRAERCIVELEALKTLFAFVGCGHCEQIGTLDVEFGASMGFSREIKVHCLKCTFVTNIFSCAREGGTDSVTSPFVINKAMVLAFSEMGKGYEASNKLSSVTNMSGLAKQSFNQHIKKVANANTDVGASVLRVSAEAVREAYKDLGNPHTGGDDGERAGGVEPPLDVAVSFDGTWHKVGFTSNYGVGVVIEIQTGLVLDYEIMSKFCHACTAVENKTMTPGERLLWEQEHLGKCKKNHNGSSKAMEKEAALAMWHRSIETHNMRYTCMLSDGDSVAHKAVNDAKVYGPHTNIEKLECINHVDKRMLSALLSRAKTEKLGGNGKGALTKQKCMKLQKYYRKALRENLGNPEAMRTAAWASLLHSVSTDDDPQHDNCPKGLQSWCFYNRAIANEDRPGTHKDNVVSTAISTKVALAIKPVYERMTDPALLTRVQHGNTSNANESLNSTIWLRCPKTVFVGLDRVKAAVASAISHFNQGTSHVSQVMAHLHIPPSPTMEVYQRNRDRERCQKSIRHAEPDFKRLRVEKKAKNKAVRLRTETREGQTYSSGLLGVLEDGLDDATDNDV